MEGVSVHPLFLALESVAYDLDSRLDMQVSRYPPVPHFLHLWVVTETVASRFVLSAERHVKYRE